MSSCPVGSGRKGALESARSRSSASVRRPGELEPHRKLVARLLVAAHRCGRSSRCRSAVEQRCRRGPQRSCEAMMVRAPTTFQLPDVSSSSTVAFGTLVTLNCSMNTEAAQAGRERVPGRPCQSIGAECTRCRFLDGGLAAQRASAGRTMAIDTDPYCPLVSRLPASCI